MKHIKKFENYKSNENDDTFNYQMLSRLQSDCDYFLGYGNGYINNLHFKNIEEHISEMKKLWNNFDEKPEWLSYDEIENYENKMISYKKNENMNIKNFKKFKMNENRNMKDFENENELINYINSNNFWFKDHNFENYEDLKNAANLMFKENTESCENQKEYYNKCGLEIGDCYLDDIETEKYYLEEENITVTVNFIKGYLDSSVPIEDYFFGYYITY
jgi:hypothetical protein